MNCDRFDRCLDALLDGACPVDEWREAERHLAGCGRCRALFDGAAGRGGALGEAEQASLAESVMRRTVGDPCASARGRLCGFVDGELEAVDRDLVSGHLAHCAACAALADAVARTARVLPGLAAVTPPLPFVTRVLDATSRRRPEPSLRDRVSAWLGRAAMRPRFSLEVAYVCTLLLAVAFGNPVKAFHETAAKGAAFVQPRVELAVGRIAGPLAAARATGKAVVEKAVGPLAPVAGESLGPAGFLEPARLWWEASVARRLRSMLGAAAAWMRSAQEWANGVASTLLDGRPAGAGSRADEPAPGRAR